MKLSFDSAKGRWYVHEVFNGKQVRRYFRSKNAAQAYFQERKADVAAFGRDFRYLDPHKRLEFMHGLKRLEDAGWDFTSAVEFVLKHGKAPPALPLESLVKEFLSAKAAKGLRPRSFRTLRASVQLFCVGRGNPPIAEITSSEIREFLTKNNWKPATMRSYLTDLRNLFEFACREGYARRNPAKAVERPLLEDSPPGILTVPQCRTLLAVCRQQEPAFLPTLVVCLLAGVRPEEARQLTWAEVTERNIMIAGHKAKTRRRRWIQVTAQLRAWLDLARATGGQLPAADHSKQFNRVRRLAGVFKGWPHDALRHSFASYHLASNKDENGLALIMGNSPTMIFNHYRNLVEPTEAGEFFAILPDNVGEAAPRPAPPCSQEPPTVGKGTRSSPRIGLPLLLAIFQGGKRAAIPRKELVGELAALGVKESTAYDALSIKRSHLAAYLEERKGRYSLAPAALASSAGDGAAAPPVPTMPAAAAPSAPTAPRPLGGPGEAVPPPPPEPAPRPDNAEP